jgi:chemotaxis protein methyltransferase CheR
MDDLEKTLSELALAMQDHREALAPKGTPKAPPAPRRKSPPDDARAALIARLLARIEAHAGLRVGEAIEARLGAVLASVELAELGRWVAGLERLDGKHPDWLTLIESLTINETFLFRDWAQLELLRTSGLAPLIATAARSAHPALRLWSAGCASGEEAYSLAVLALETLAGAGVASETAQEIELKAPWSLDVLGTDISRPMLIQARNGLYSTGSLSPFRAVAQPLLRFFPPADGEQARANRIVRSDVRRHVRFDQSNLMGPAPAGGGFDVVACRNVLVYFAPAARKIVQATLEAAVRRGGFLLLGPTDAPPDTARFETIWGQRAVIYRKRA